jgi:SAM-dependent methyltransferase
MSGSQNQEATNVSQKHFGESYGGGAPENYERFFVPAIGAPLAADLLEVAALRPGERVLDVACGTGVVTRLAAERVGSAGAVAGLDLNPGMLAVARSVAPSEMKIEWHEASAESMPLPDESFGVVLCQLGLQFVPDKSAALREIRRVLVPGGRFVMNVPGPTPPLFAIADEALGRYIGPEAAGFVRLVFSLHDPGELRGLLRGAGLEDVEVRVEHKTLRLPPPENFLWQYVQSTPLAAAVARADEERRAALGREVVGKWQEFVKDGGLVFELRLLVATARK